MDGVRIIPMTEATRLSRVVAAAELVPKIRAGLQLPPDVLAVPAELVERFLLVDPAGELVSVAHVEGERVVYDRVFVP
jgi:hypothetical protein